jgi:tetratricopeptide (TPR) repeat protein
VLFNLVEQGHPDSEEILATFARAYMHRLRYKPAFACLTKWIAYQPQNAKPVHWRGWVLERLNNPKGAKDDYEHALELDPSLLAVRLRLVEMFLEDKQAPDALPHLEILYKQAPQDVRVRARLGMCRFLQGQTKEARQLMEGALSEMPNDAPLLISLASLDLQEGRAVEAERLLRAVLEADPVDTEALFVLASALQFQNRTDEATTVLAEHERKRALINRLNALLKDAADSPTATADNYAELGNLFLQIGRDKVALYWLDRALDREPGNARAHNSLAGYYEGKGDRTQAEAHRRQIREATPSPTPKTP